MKLLYYADVEPGGLANYAIHQVESLQKVGVDVTVLGLAELNRPLAANCANVDFIELFDSPRGKNKWVRGVQAITRKRRQARQLNGLIDERKFKHVLISSYAEYYSPFWAGILQRQHRRGVRFGVIVHDPIRDFQIGPLWWHRWSVARAYSFIDVAFVHDDTLLDLGARRFPIETRTIPFGIPNQLPASSGPTRDTKSELQIPADAKVWLSFGHIRDSKNLDLAIKALKHFPNDYLIVAGREQSGSQRNLASYQRVADDAGVGGRCRWVNEFIPDEDVANYFHISDLLILLYAASFRSASGVLRVAAQFELPVIASGGPGPLKTDVEKYDLGVFVEPDSFDAAVRGLRQVTHSNLNANWAAFRTDNSWKKNAEEIVRAMGNS